MKRSLITSSWVRRAQSLSVQFPVLEFNARDLDKYRVVLMGADLAGWEARFTEHTGLTTIKAINWELGEIRSIAAQIKQCCILVLCARNPHILDSAKKAIALLRSKGLQVVVLLNTAKTIESIKQTQEYTVAKDADFGVVFHSQISFAEDLKQDKQVALYSPCTAVEELVIELFTENDG